MKRKRLLRRRARAVPQQTNTEIMKRKALFFDVDGTLLSEITHQVPESAKRALSETRKRGNLVFINSGRGYGFLRDIEQMIEHDGCLCGCGTCVADAEGHIHLQYRIPHERGIEIKKAVEELFPGTKVKKVNTLNVRGQKRRQGANVGYTPSWKKAVVTLTEDSKEIEFFNDMM